MIKKKWMARLLCVLMLFSVLLPREVLAMPQAKPESSISSYDKDRPQDLTTRNLYAQSAILIDGQTGRVLFSKHSSEQLCPASITKILTALLVIERLDLDQTVIASKAATLMEPTNIDMKEGDHYTVRDLLYGMLLKSGNNAAYALAEAVAGDVDSFVEMMNEKAQELGMADSRFSNPHGLPAENHYTTASDYAKVAFAASQNETFMEIISANRYTMEIKDKDGNTRSYTAKCSNAMLPDSGEKYAYEYMLGGKTGFTNAAQNTFVGYASKDGVLLISVVLGTTQEGKWLDTRKLMDYGFAAFSQQSLSSLYALSPIEATVEKVGEGQSNLLKLDLAQDEHSILCNSAQLDDLKANFANYCKVEYLSPPLTAPIQQGDVVAQLHFQYESMPEIVIDLVASRTVATDIIPISPTPAPSIRVTADNGLSIFTNAAGENKFSPLLLLVIIPVALFFLLIIWLVVEIRRYNEGKRRRRQAAREAEIRRRREAARRRNDAFSQRIDLEPYSGRRETPRMPSRSMSRTRYEQSHR